MVGIRICESDVCFQYFSIFPPGKGCDESLAHTIKLPRSKLSTIRAYIFTTNQRATDQNKYEAIIYVQLRFIEIGESIVCSRMNIAFF